MIFLDFSMPGMDGPAFARKLREFLDYENEVQPFICCCSSYNSDYHIDTALTSGMDRYLRKPIPFEELKEIT